MYKVTNKNTSCNADQYFKQHSMTNIRRKHEHHAAVNQKLPSDPTEKPTVSLQQTIK
jgi:hypothetical protein